MTARPRHGLAYSFVGPAPSAGLRVESQDKIKSIVPRWYILRLTPGFPLFTAHGILQIEPCVI